MNTKKVIEEFREKFVQDTGELLMHNQVRLLEQFLTDKLEEQEQNFNKILNSSRKMYQLGLIDGAMKTFEELQNNKEFFEHEFTSEEANEFVSRIIKGALNEK